MTDLRRRHCHLVYGLAIDSDFELRGLPAAPPDSMAPRVRITRASIREPSLAQRDPSIFVKKPISVGLLILGAVILALMLLPAIKRSREVVFHEP